MTAAPPSSLPSVDTTEAWMRLAIAEAEAARADDEVPIGCVIVQGTDGRVIGRGHNRRITHRDPTAHAEIMAIRQAGEALGDWRLTDCTLVVTLEPCPMCAGAILNARIGTVVYGCSDPKAGAVRTLFQLCDDPRLNHRATVIPGVLADACAALLRNFFVAQRQVGNK